MKNKIVGSIVIGIALIIGFITYLFNKALKNIISTACSHGSECAMWGTLNVQTNISIGLMIFIILIGLYLIFFGKEEKIITKIKKVKEQVEPKKLTKENFKDIMKNMNNEEKQVFNILLGSRGSIHQSKIIYDTNFSKVKVTRILDKLEGKGLLERKRRGMTNIVILKH